MKIKRKVKADKLEEMELATQNLEIERVVQEKEREKINTKDMEERAESLREDMMSIEVEVAQLKSERSQIQSQIEASLPAEQPQPRHSPRRLPRLHEAQ